MRRRRSLNFPLILGILLSVNILVACYRSQITAIRTINLVGLRYSERLRTERMQVAIKGIPAMQLDPATVEQLFLGQSRVKRADFRRNIFGSARLTVVYRTPVGKLGANVFIDADGVIFADPEATPDVTKLLLAKGLKLTVTGMMGVVDFRGIAETCKIVSTKVPSASVEVLDTGMVCLNMDGARIILGSTTDLESKIDALIGLLNDRPDLLKGIYELNLMNYNAPSIRPKKNDKPVHSNP